MSDPFWQPLFIFLAAVLLAIITPLATVFASSYARRKEREDDRKDRAEVAAQVREAAKRAQEAAALLVESNAEVAAAAAKAAERTNGQLKQIHTLVNNQLTTAISTAMDGLKTGLISMKELIEVKKSLGQEPTADTIAAVAALEARISELSQQLVDRRSAAEAVAKEQKENPVDQK